MHTAFMDHSCRLILIYCESFCVYVSEAVDLFCLSMKDIFLCLQCDIDLIPKDPPETL